jgi:hypothetical protein
VYNFKPEERTQSSLIDEEIKEERSIPQAEFMIDTSSKPKFKEMN